MKSIPCQETTSAARDAGQINTPETVAAFMRTSKTEQEWNANCDKVKAANGGYPNFWYQTVILSGLFGEVSDKFTRG